MPVSRREFTKAGLAGAVLASIGGSKALAESNGLIHRSIPSSGEAIPVIGVGTNRYGVGNDLELRQPLRDSLARFHELGGTVIDTAPQYRSSETVLGELIDELDIGADIFMATKIDQQRREDNAATLDRSIERLGFPAIDLMQCHNLIGWEIAIPQMHEWKAAGRIRYVGITTSRQNQYELMEKIMKAHDLDFIQINYSLADQRSSAERLLPLAADRGMAVMVNRPFGGGNAFEKLSKTTLPEWAADIDCANWGQFLLKYVLSNPAVSCAIPGMTKVRHVEDNLAAAIGRMPTAEQRKKQESFFDSL
jgi:aryl-alcohol dehydrogenase-like predicted oxidoreductase